MKRFLPLFLLLSLCVALCGCAEPAPEAASDKVQIVATVFPAYDFARQIAGERAEVMLLIPPGTEVHSFEPTARDVTRIANADLLVCNGGESEAWLEELLEGQDGARSVFYMLDCVDALEEELKEGMQASEEEEDGEEGPEYDEHVWTSPVNAQRICRALTDRLCEADSDGEESYRTACDEYCAQLAQLDEAFREVTDGAARRTVIFADRFPVRYFVEEYGLDYYAAFPGCAEDTEPAAGTVAFLIDKVREEQIPAVFYIEFSNEKMADIIAEDTGCEKLLFHSCHNVSADALREGVGYLELMRGNVISLKEALG
ncbi:MAG: zinc ABC transporter substrate-binding protein [Oscillospiraceae bacterium]|nr:zinc ABC transporter substrate-binding protein [Oscillospiraceae bacterium]